MPRVKVHEPGHRAVASATGDSASVPSHDTSIASANPNSAMRLLQVLEEKRNINPTLGIRFPHYRNYLIQELRILSIIIEAGYQNRSILIDTNAKSLSQIEFRKTQAVVEIFSYIHKDEHQDANDEVFGFDLQTEDIDIEVNDEDGQNFSISDLMRRFIDYTKQEIYIFILLSETIYDREGVVFDPNLKALISICFNKSSLLDILNEERYDTSHSKEFLIDYMNDIERIEGRIVELFSEAAAMEKANPRRFREFCTRVSSLVTERSAYSALPETAPERYLDRQDPNEKPDAFILRVYGKWLGDEEGLKRPDIKHLDESLYAALYKHGIPKDFDRLLPKAPGRKRKAITSSAEETLEHQRALARERNRRLYHKRKNQT